MIQFDLLLRATTEAASAVLTHQTFTDLTWRGKYTKE